MAVATNERTIRAVRMARHIVLTTDMSANQALSMAAREGLRQLEANEAVARRGTDVEGVYQMRVGLRRLKVTLSLARQLDLAPDRDVLKAELDWIGDTLGKARDLDVFVGETIGALLAEHEGSADFDRLYRRVTRVRKAAYAELRVALGSPRYAEAKRRLADWIAVLETTTSIDQSLIEIAAELLERRRKRIAKFVKKNGWQTKKTLHDFRLHAKKLRYTTAFFASLYPKADTKSFLSAASDLQDVLGFAHDSEVARHILVALGTRRTVESAPLASWREADELVDSWHRARAAEITRDIEPSWQTLENAKPFW